MWPDDTSSQRNKATIAGRGGVWTKFEKEGGKQYSRIGIKKKLLFRENI